MCVCACLFQRDLQLLKATAKNPNVSSSRGSDRKERSCKRTRGRENQINKGYMLMECMPNLAIREVVERKWEGGKKKSEREMKNEASLQTGRRQHHILPVQQSLGNTQGILGNAVRRATAQWLPDWLL